MGRSIFRVILFPALILLAFQLAALAEPPQVGSPGQQIPGNSQDKDAPPPTQKADALPARVLIPGVPFISWREAAQLKFEDSGIANPSISATLGMVLEYWGKDRKLLEQAGYDFETSGLKNMGGSNSENPWTIADLKSSLARGVPVFVSLPLTPVAHPLYSMFEMFIKTGQGKGVELKDQGRPRSNALGQMLSLEDLQKFTEQMKVNPTQEALLMAFRLIIGYDDEKKIFIVHDPSFGPAFELRYADFDKMWEAVDRRYAALLPNDASQKTTANQSAVAYRDRTPDEQAAMHFVYGYAMDCAGRLAEGEEHFEKGLSIPGISKGYQFLLQFELALNRGERNDIPRAIEAAEKATALLPEHPFPWGFLSQLHTISPDGGNRKKAKEADNKSKALAADQEAQKIVSNTLPADFWIQYLAGIRGWGGSPKP